MSAGASAPPGRGITLGVFDGLHLGHRSLVERLVEACASRDLLPAVVTLDPHPDVVLGHAPPRPPLTPVHTQAALLAEWGAREFRVLRFDEHVRQAAPEEFVAAYLAGRLGARVLVIGPDFAMGRNREGTAERLARLGQKYGFEVLPVEPVQDERGRISSSRLRHLLDEGRVREASMLLGRPFETHGRVGHGRGLGQGMGFPTANLTLAEPAYLPADGVYLGRASGEFGDLHCLASLGTRPTFGPGERVLEVYVLDFKGDLRNKPLRLQWLDFQRSQQQFQSVEDLKEQMQEDEREARERIRREFGPPGADA